MSPIPDGSACREIPLEGGYCIEGKQSGNSPLVIFDESPYQYRTQFEKDLSYLFFLFGIGADIVELGLQITPAFGPLGPIVASFVDVGVTAIGCYLAGECYIGKPTPQSETMLVIGQDVIVSTAEAIAPIMVLAGVIVGTKGSLYPVYSGTDIVTSILDAGYDIGRMTGSIPNKISLGFSPEISIVISTH